MSSIEQLINDIKSNNVTTIKFVADDDDVIDNVHDVIDVLKSSGNTSVTNVEMTDDFLGCVRNDARSELLKSLGCLKSIQEVKLQEGLLLIHDIAEMLLEAKTLKVLTLRDIVLQGVESDFHAIELALHQHPSIKTFTLDECRPAVDGMESTMEAVERAGKKQTLLHGGGIINTSGASSATSSSSRAA